MQFATTEFPNTKKLVALIARKRLKNHQKPMKSQFHRTATRSESKLWSEDDPPCLETITFEDAKTKQFWETSFTKLKIWKAKHLSWHAQILTSLSYDISFSWQHFLHTLPLGISTSWHGYSLNISFSWHFLPFPSHTFLICSSQPFLLAVLSFDTCVFPTPYRNFLWRMSQMSSAGETASGTSSGSSPDEERGVARLLSTCRMSKPWTVCSHLHHCKCRDWAYVTYVFL